jgi:hypothetical protein
MKAKAALKSLNLYAFNNLEPSNRQPAKPGKAAWICSGVRAALMKIASFRRLKESTQG